MKKPLKGACHGKMRKEPIRVIHVVSTMDFGGAETLIMNIYRNIDREKLQFDFLCHNRTEAMFSEEIYQLGGRMFSVAGPSHSGLFGYMKQLFVFFKTHPEYNTVPSHQNYLSGLILWMAKLAGIKNRYSHSHVSYSSVPLKRRIEFALFKIAFFGATTRRFACAEAAKESIYYSWLSKNVIILPNAIEVSKFAFDPEARKAKRMELGFSENDILIGHVGRFSPPKNHEFLIKIFSDIAVLDKSTKLVLVGEGGLRLHIQEEAEKLGLIDRVLFLGVRSDVDKLLQCFDLLLFPSRWEGLSVACVEAQAAGLPVLTSDTVSREVALTDLVHFMPLDRPVQEWAEKALELVATGSGTDRKQYAAQVAEKGFDIHKMAEFMQDIYLHDSYGPEGTMTK